MCLCASATNFIGRIIKQKVFHPRMVLQSSSAAVKQPNKQLNTSFTNNLTSKMNLSMHLQLAYNGKDRSGEI